MRTPERKSVYTIPDNFIDEGRVVRGMFRTRYFMEGLAMALVVAFFISFIPLHGLKEKITAYTLGCSPFFLLGITGIGGDPVFAFIKNYFTWLKKKGIYFYNGESRALASSPVENMMEADDAKAKLAAYVELMRKKREESRRMDLVEGVDFEFAEDKELSGNYADEEYENEDTVDSDSDDASDKDSEPDGTLDEGSARNQAPEPAAQNEDIAHTGGGNTSVSEKDIFDSWEDEVF